MRVALQRKTLLAGIWLALLGLAVQSYVALAPLARAWKPDQLDLSGIWNVCRSKTSSGAGCAWSPQHVPGTLPKELRESLPGWIVYQLKFTAPKSCFQESSACALIIGQTGDAVEARLNNVIIGRHGDFPPNARYARHYPARFDISRDLLRPDPNANELDLTVYSGKKTQAGIDGGPLGIFSSGQGFLVSRTITTLNVVLPIAGFVALLFMGLIPALAGFVSRQRDPRLDSYIAFCVATALFLFSFSETPREWIPIWVAGYLHFLTRITSDWAYFEMVQTYYDLGPRWKRLARPGYWAAMSLYATLLLAAAVRPGFRESGFDTAYVITRIIFPLLLLPHICGFIGAWRERGAFTGRVFMPFFALTLAMQVHDCLIFHGFISGTYAVKIYPVFIGAAFGWLMLERHWRERERLAVADGIAEVMTQVAHDVKAPLAALDWIASHAEGLPEDDQALLREAAGRIREISADVLRRYRSGSPASSNAASAGIADGPTVIDAARLAAVVGSLVAEKRAQFRQLGGVAIKFRTPSGDFKSRARLNPADLKRALCNLINNAVEAVGDSGVVTVALAFTDDQAVLTVRDTGRGIPPDILSKLGGRGVTSGKPEGCGFGLHFARRCAEKWRGSFRIASEPGFGTTVELTVPWLGGTPSGIEAAPSQRRVTT